jgi:hypothetical protein
MLRFQDAVDDVLDDYTVNGRKTHDRPSGVLICISRQPFAAGK